MGGTVLCLWIPCFIWRYFKAYWGWGKWFVSEKRKNGETALHTMLYNNTLIEITLKLVEVGGDEILLVKNSYRMNLLVYPLFKKRESNRDTRKKRSKSRENLMIFLFWFLRNVSQLRWEENLESVAVSILNQKNWWKWIYRKWKLLVPSLELAIADLERMPPILHAAVIANALQSIIVDIINCFDCICTSDSLNRYPIDVEIEEGLVDGCDNGR